MRRSIVFAWVGLAIALTASLVVGWAAGRNPKSNPKKISVSQDPGPRVKPIPEHLSYWMLFQNKVLLDQKAKEVEKQGGDMSLYRSRLKSFANLDDHESQLLGQVSHDTYDRVRAQDNKAKEIIARLRASKEPPDGKFQVGQGNPETPAELKALQRERDEIIKRGVAKLAEGFGSSRFADLDRVVKREITPNIINLMSNPPKRNFDPRTDPKVQEMIKNYGRSK